MVVQRVRRPLRSIRAVSGQKAFTLPFMNTHARRNQSTVAMERELNAARNYCQEMIQKYDYASHILKAFSPRDAVSRDSYLALRTFNLSTALIPEQVSQLVIGKMRIQFWRDMINSVFSSSPTTKPTPPKEPVAILLNHILCQPDTPPLSRSFFLKILSARESFLGNPPLPALQDLESYAEGTYSTLLYLQLESLGLFDPRLDHIASHIGKAIGIATVLRSIPHLVTQFLRQHDQGPPGGIATGGGGLGAENIPLPLHTCAKHNLRQEDILRQGSQAPGLKDVVFEVATHANDHLITARKHLSDAALSDMAHTLNDTNELRDCMDEAVLAAGGGYNGARGRAHMINPKNTGPFSVFMHAIPTRVFLERLEKADFDIFDSRLHRKGDWKVPWTTYWGWKRRSI